MPDKEKYVCRGTGSGSGGSSKALLLRVGRREAHEWI